MTIYLKLVALVGRLRRWLHPRARRLLRFLALPYCFAREVQWDVCPLPPHRVAADLLYVFFRLRSYPDFYSMCRLWEVDRRDWRFYYGSIYDAWQRDRMQRHVQPPELQVIFNDKQVCHDLCRAADLPEPRHFGFLRADDDAAAMLSGILEREPDLTLIVKPTRGRGGKGIRLVYREDGEIKVRTGGDASPLAASQVDGDAVVQQYLTQHDELARVAPSVNTLRLLTLLTAGGEVLVLCGTMRFGVGGAFIDNMSSGGLGVGVHVDGGTLFRHGYDFAGRRFDRHPDSDIAFEGFTLPHWDGIMDLARRTQMAFPYYKLLGLDIAVTPEGPVLIEINAEPDTASEEINEPLLHDPRIRREFQAYDLIVHDLLADDH